MMNENGFMKFSTNVFKFLKEERAMWITWTKLNVGTMFLLTSDLSTVFA